jgi:hypothetical protein
MNRSHFFLRVRTLAIVLCWTFLALADDQEKVPDPKDLPVQYRIDPYLAAVQSFQTMGKEKALVKLQEFAAKDKATYCTGTQILCRMLFKAKEGSSFRSARLGSGRKIGSTTLADWPLEPITIVDGVPFKVTVGFAKSVSRPLERASDYVDYCIEECDWNTYKFTPKSIKEKRDALDKLLSTPKLKGKVSDRDQEFLEKQIETK